MPSSDWKADKVSSYYISTENSGVPDISDFVPLGKLNENSIKQDRGLMTSKNALYHRNSYKSKRIIDNKTQRHGYS